MKVKNSRVMASLLVISEERPLKKAELALLRYVQEKAQFEEIESAISKVQRSRGNPALRGQLLKDRPTVKVPPPRRIRKPQRKRGYTDKGSLPDVQSQVLRKILKESLISVLALREENPRLANKIVELGYGPEWLTIEDARAFANDYFFEEADLDYALGLELIPLDDTSYRELVEARLRQLRQPFRTKNAHLRQKAKR